MADPLSSLLQKKKEEAKATVLAPADTQGAPPGKVRGLFDFDQPFASSNSAAPTGGVTSNAPVGEQLLNALTPGSNVDFPMITNICERVAKEPREAAEAVRLLVGAFGEQNGPPRRRLKAITIMHELMHDQRAVAELCDVPGARDALWQLQAMKDSGLGASADEQMRMFATEVEKKCFGTFGDPFALPADPFTLPTAPPTPAAAPLAGDHASAFQPRVRKRDQALDMFSKIGSVVQANLAAAGAVAQTNLAAAQEAAMARVQGTQGRSPEIPRLPANPDAIRPVLNIQFDNMLEGECVHHAVQPAFLLNNSPLCETPGRLLVTNYRLKFQVQKGTLREELQWLQEKQVMDVPMGAVEEVKLESRLSETEVPEWKLRVVTKDFRCLTILVNDGHELAVVEEAVAALSQPGPSHTQVLFAFRHAEALRAAGGNADDADGWGLYDPVAEFARMGVDTPSCPASACPWFLCTINRQYGLCDTYPAWLVEPRGVSDQDLRSASGFRKRNRLPTMSWCAGVRLGFASLWRCAQPTEGILGNACLEDERLVLAIRNGIAAGRDRELLVVDLRPKKAAYANKVGGGGFESYEGCRLVFGGIDNVHGVREAWRKMGQAVVNLSSSEVGSWFRDVANSGWYDILGAVLGCVSMVVKEIDTHRCNVMIHCSDGWDRTAQVSSLVMLCMDPHYRTLRGFLLLIQKEFCSFGHRFRTRLANGEKPTSEYSPIFLQWLECVYQLTAQFPAAFEFTPAVLLLVGREALTNRFGTFLGDNERERVERIAPRTLSFWPWLLSLRAQEHLNPQYRRCEETLRPSPAQVNFRIWEDYWFRYRLHPKGERRQL